MTAYLSNISIKSPHTHTHTPRTRQPPNMRCSLLTLSASLSFALAQTPSLSELLQSQPDLSLLADALTVVPELAATLSGATNITILAPTNGAFEALLAGGPNVESQAVTDRNPEGINTLLAYHVIKGTYLSTNFTDVPTYVSTEFDQSFTISGTVQSNVTEGQHVGLVLNGQNATILSGELQTSNVVEAVSSRLPSHCTVLTMAGYHCYSRSHYP
jgi:uncharacterized surface protein with fasciclin (FAS1) repeats